MVVHEYDEVRHCITYSTVKSRIARIRKFCSGFLLLIPMILLGNRW